MSNNLYTKGQFLDFCKEVFGDYQITKAGTNIQVLCPICYHLKKKHGKIYNKKKLAIEINTHVLHCWVCSYKSKNLLHLLKKYKSNFVDSYIENFKNSILLDANLGNDIIVSQEVTIPDGFELLALNLNSKNNYINKILNYLKSRGINKEEDIWYWRFGFAQNNISFSNRVVIPSFDKDGKLNYYTARTLIDANPKYLNPFVNREHIIFNELNIQWDKELTLVEGVFDLIKCNENATCILGSELTANYELFQKIVLNKTPVVLGLDPDATKKTMNIAERLYEFCVPVKIIEYNNMNDIGSKTKKEFNDLLINAKVYDTEYMLKQKLNSIWDR